MHADSGNQLNSLKEYFVLLVFYAKYKTLQVSNGAGSIVIRKYDRRLGMRNSENDIETSV